MNVTMVKDDIPCCAAEAMRRIKQIDVDGVTAGLAMPEDICRKVSEMKISGSERIADELMREIKTYNYVPEPAYEKYRYAVMKEYEHMNDQNQE